MELLEGKSTPAASTEDDNAVWVPSDEAIERAAKQGARLVRKLQSKDSTVDLEPLLNQMYAFIRSQMDAAEALAHVAADFEPADLPPVPSHEEYRAVLDRQVGEKRDATRAEAALYEAESPADAEPLPHRPFLSRVSILSLEIVVTWLPQGRKSSSRPLRLI